MYLYAAVEIPPRPEGFYDFAKRFQQVTGIRLTESDRFNELSGFVGTQRGLEYTLVGSDFGASDDTYRLDVDADYDSPEAFQSLLSEVNEFERSFLIPKNADELGRVKLSGELASAMDLIGIRDCRPI